MRLLPPGTAPWNLNFHIPGSRLKFTYLSDDKKIKGYTEIRLRSRSQGLNIDIRHAYFNYSWDGSSVLFGQASSVVSQYYSNQMLEAGNCQIGYGKAYQSRTEQIRLTMSDKYKQMFTMESSKVTSDYEDADGNTVGLGYTSFPAFSAAMDMSFGNVNIYSWIRWEWNRVTTGDDEDVN